LLSGTTGTEDSSILNEMLSLLPEPRALRDVISEVRHNLSTHPQAMLGEVGLDRAFRIPLLPYGSPPPRKLSPFTVPMEHQIAVMEAQLALAVELGRNVSVHSVKCQQVTVELLKRMKEKYAERWGAINLDLHSCGFSAETWKAVERNYPNVFLSLSATINGRTSGLRALIAAASADRLLIESDWHDITLCTGSTWEILLLIAEVKGWRVEETWEDKPQSEPGAVRRIEQNWQAFRSGGMGLAVQKSASNRKQRKRRDYSLEEGGGSDEK